jgi:hypothetical protein
MAGTQVIRSQTQAGRLKSSTSQCGGRSTLSASTTFINPILLCASDVSIKKSIKENRKKIEKETSFIFLLRKEKKRTS